MEEYLLFAKVLAKEAKEYGIDTETRGKREICTNHYDRLKKKK